MHEHRCQSENIFLETEAFARSLSESQRERLYFDLMRGSGAYIADTGGLKRIGCHPPGESDDAESEVVFVEYPYPDMQKRIFLLLNKFPLPLERTLTKEEKRILRQLKAKADRYVERYCERLQEEEPNG